MWSRLSSYEINSSTKPHTYTKHTHKHTHTQAHTYTKHTQRERDTHTNTHVR